MPLEATRTNNLTRLTWEAPDTDMSDSLQAFTLKRSTDNGATFPTTVAVVQPGGAYSVDDSTAIPAGGSLTWELLEQTLNGVVVPYSKPVASNVAPGTAVWARAYGTKNSTVADGSDHGDSVCCDTSGNIFLTGFVDVSGSLFPDMGDTSVIGYGLVLAKYSPSNVHITHSIYGPYAGNSTLGFGQGLSVATLNGKIIVGGTFQGSGLLDFSGNQRSPGAALTPLGAEDGFISVYSDTIPFSWNWTRQIGTASLDQFGAKQTCQVYGVATDSSGNVFAIGTFSASVNFGDATRTTPSGTASIFLIKLRASDGATLWSKKLGSLEINQGIQLGHGVAVNSSGDVLVAGNFRGSDGTPADFGDGHTLVSNFTTDSHGVKAYHLDIFVAKYRGSDGVCQWAVGYGGPSDDYAYGIALTTQGDAMVVGSASSPVDLGNGSTSLTSSFGAFIARYSGVNGAHQWSFAFPASAVPLGTQGVAINSSGEVFSFGDFQSGSVMLPFADGPHAFPLASPSNINSFLIKWNPNGDGLGGALASWAKAYGVTGGTFGGTIRGNGCTTGPDNNPVITGKFQATEVNTGLPFTTIIDPITLNTIGSYDIFLAKVLH